MNNEEMINNLINGVGAMAEITVLYFNELTNRGLDASTASILTSNFIRSIINLGKGE